MKKILITGCGGMLGSAIYPILKEAGYELVATDIDLNESWLNYLDVRDFTKFNEKCMEFQPDMILHLAALTSLEYCEDNPQEAFKTNFLGTKNSAVICKRMNIPLVHISTAGVFDGTQQRYTEEACPNPLNVYGKTKFYAEIAVENYLKKYFIVRAGWMVGGSKKDKKFVSYICSQILEGRKKFNVVNDKFGTLTYTKDFAKNLIKLMNTSFYGRYHMVCHGETDRYLTAKKILDFVGVKNYTIKKVSSEFFKKDFPVKRAESERLVNKKLKLRKIDIMRDWESALEEYLTEDWKELFEKTQ